MIKILHIRFNGHMNTANEFKTHFTTIEYNSRLV